MSKKPIDPQKDYEAREKLTQARVGLLLRAPFFGNLATRLKLINADDWCQTAATDGRNFYYNTDFVNKMPSRQVEFLFGHEILHVAYDHMGRRGHRDPKVHNIAADFCVNADLIDQKIGDKITVCGMLYDPKYAGWSSEEVYDDLMKNADKQKLSELAQQLLDEHLDEFGDDADGEGDGKDGDGKGKGRPRISDAERRQIQDEFREAMIAAAQSAGAGNTPAGIKRLLKELTEPKINWKELLEQQIQSTIKSDYTWARPSRKGWDLDAILPGTQVGQQIDIAISIDQSGSISNADAKIFLSEIKGIMDAYTEYKIRLWCFDTAVHNEQTFTSDNMEDVAGYVPMGGGGTVAMCNWDYMKEHDIEPKKFIMFTDGEFFGDYGDPDYCETVFIIKGNPKFESPFGIWAHFEDFDKN